VAQGVGPEFKYQYCKNRKKKYTCTRLWVQSPPLGKQQPKNTLLRNTIPNSKEQKWKAHILLLDMTV
jgi:hypothetical protein